MSDRTHLDNLSNPTSELESSLSDAKGRLERYKHIFDALLDEIHIWELVRDKNGNIKTWRLIDANETALKNWGKNKSDVLLKTTEVIFPDADPVNTFKPIVERIFKENQPYEWEAFFEDTGQTLFMKSIPMGEHFISTGFDITELKNTQEGLLSANLRLKEATTAGKVGVWDWHIQNDLMVWDAQMHQLYGIDPDAGIKRFSLWEAALHPDDAIDAKQAVADAIAGRKEYDIVFRIFRPDDSIRFIKGNGTVIRDESGQAVRMIGTNLDITERYEAEATFNRLTNELNVSALAKQAFFDAILDCVIVIDQRGIIQECNEATVTMFGYQRNEMHDQNVSMLMESSIAEQHDRYLSEHLKTGHSNVIGQGREVLARKKSGDLFYVHLSVA